MLIGGERMIVLFYYVLSLLWVAYLLWEERARVVWGAKIVLVAILMPPIVILAILDARTTRLPNRLPSAN